MKKYYLLFCIFFFSYVLKAQQITVSGGGISGTATLTEGSGDINGYPYYTGTGTVLGNDGVQIAIYWQTPDNVWVLTYSGQPYFYCSYASALPPGTAFQAWTLVPGNPSVGSDPLSISGDVSLPVTLSNFTAKQENETIVLSWKTGTEFNNKGFEVQRSTDKANWTDLAFVNGAGTTSAPQTYAYTDTKFPFAGIVYYRLLQTDFDGSVKSSGTIDVQVSGLPFYRLLSNPGKGVFTVAFTQSVANTVLMVYDVSGKMILKENAVQGNNRLDISNYPAGIYFLRITNGNNRFSEKLIKQ